ncbi:MAG TPA: BACON domain-containing carbohydrate-binding protein [Marinilabiliaceae bacterium]|nr:BACON domain-containing carbohydrate-binding protein [Marinilabiliaceae bacterium]
MKLKYLFPILIAILALMTSCEDEETVTLLDEIKVSSSFVSLPVDGGSSAITVTAQDSWIAEKVFIMKNDTVVKDSVSWLVLSSTTGSAGETKLTFSAEAAIDGRTAEVKLIMDTDSTKIQRINIIQGLPIISEATVAGAKVAPDGKTLRLSGVVTKIENTIYGNWRLNDETGEILIYGTLDKKGGTKNFESLGIEVGDDVTIEGPKSTYGGAAQMVDVMVIEIKKSLIKVDSVENESLPIEGGEFTAYLTVKGEGVSVDIPEDAKSWLSISSIQSAGESAVVKFKATPNTGGDRGTTLKFRTTKDSKEYSTETTLSQKGAIVNVTVAEFIAAEVDDTQYRLTGVITKIDTKYNNNINISDFSGETYVYRLDLDEKEYKVGDIVTVVGKRGEYNGHQLINGVLESFIPVTPITIAEVLTKPDSKEDYFMVAGEITSVVSELIGRLYLKDESGEIYVFGCSPGFGASTNDEKNGLLEAKGIKVGDKLTVIATKGSYQGTGQLTNGFYFSHVSAE